MLPCPLNGGGAGPDGNAVPVLNLSGEVVGLAARVSFKHSRGSRRRTKRGDESTAVEVQPTQNLQVGIIPDGGRVVEPCTGWETQPCWAGGRANPLQTVFLVTSGNSMLALWPEFHAPVTRSMSVLEG